MHYYYTKDTHTVSGDFPRWEVVIISTFPLPNPSRKKGTKNLPKFSFGTRIGTIFERLLLGQILVRSVLRYLGWSYKNLRFFKESDVDFFKERKVRFLCFETRAGKIWVRHEYCALSGETALLVPPKKLEKKNGENPR